MISWLLIFLIFVFLAVIYIPHHFLTTYPTYLILCSALEPYYPAKWIQLFFVSPICISLRFLLILLSSQEHNKMKASEEEQIDKRLTYMRTLGVIFKCPTCSDARKENGEYILCQSWTVHYTLTNINCSSTH